ncbi:MAG: RluA family pseudouridine synthase [Chitinophagales bacterium]|jgi:23S rRNA pseudouridine1911/1915/1917 synthase|nr:RluA family pseudouridine synthase [Chitinophagales bacterium]
MVEFDDISSSSLDTSDDDLLTRELSLIVDKGQEPIRIDKFLVNRVERISRTKFQYAAEAGSLMVNGKSVKASYKVQPLDEIFLQIPMPLGYESIKPENIPLNIIYQDEEILLINKPPGLVVHPGVGNFTGTLVNALLYHVAQLAKSKDTVKPGIVHRLDKDTSGVMIVAKDEYSLAFLAKQFFDKTNERKYIALVWGDLLDETGFVESFIGRDKHDRKKMASYSDENYGKYSYTAYKVIKRFGYVTLIECELKTGRTHQIRVHMASIGHPVFNDKRYGGDKICKGTIFSKYKQFVDNCFQVCPRQALHAATLGIIHPKHQEKMCFEAILPEDMMLLIEKWSVYVENRF